MMLRIVGISRLGSVRVGSGRADRGEQSRGGVGAQRRQDAGLPPASRAASAAKSASPPTDSTRSPAGDTASSMVRLPMQTSGCSAIVRRRGVAAQAEVIADQLGGQQVEQGRQRLREPRGSVMTRPPRSSNACSPSVVTT